MSFNINWSQTRNDLSSMTTDLLNNALNSGKSNILTSEIKILDLEFGNQQPNFEILEIGELTKESFRGIFKLDYEGDARLNLKTTVEANPINIYTNNTKDLYGEELTQFISPKFVMSNDSFSIPLKLQLSKIKINSIIIIVFSKTKGLTLVFRNEPLERIVINSSFDNINPLKDFLQKKIETQIKDIIKDILPSLLYELSLNYVSKSSNNIEDIHKKLQEKLNEDKKTLFKEIDEDSQDMSAKNLMILSRLSASCQSLLLNKNRFDSGVLNKTLLQLLEKNSKSQIYKFKLNDVENLTENDLENLIDHIQNMNNLKNAKISRRKIKIGGKKKKQQDQSVLRNKSAITNNATPNASLVGEDSAHNVTTTTDIEFSDDNTIVDEETSMLHSLTSDTKSNVPDTPLDVMKHPIPQPLNIQYELQQLHNYRQKYLNSPLKPQFHSTSSLFKGLNYNSNNPTTRLSPPPPPPPYSF